MGVFELLAENYRSFVRHRSSFLAATISYYAFLSLFPLLLFVISLLGFFLESSRVHREILVYVDSMFPASVELIRNNLQAIVREREGVGLIGLLGLLWTGTAVFSALEYALNTIWSVPTPRHFLKHRLLAFLLVLTGALLVLVSLTATSLVSSLKGLFFHYASDAGTSLSLLLPFVSVLVGLTTSIAIFFLTYFVIPNVYHRWKDVWLGATVGGLSWETAKYAFSWYLSTLARYRLLYGTLGAVIALLVWIYISALILLFGAELNLSYQNFRLRRKPMS